MWHNQKLVLNVALVIALLPRESGSNFTSNGRIRISESDKITCEINLKISIIHIQEMNVSDSKRY